MESSPLVLLPPELRNRIYESVLKDNCAIVLSGIKNRNQLTRTCREVREECWKMFWALNEFRLTVLPEDDKTKLAHWIFDLLYHRLDTVLPLIPSMSITIWHHGHAWWIQVLHARAFEDIAVADGCRRPNLGEWAAIGDAGTPTNNLCRQIVRAYKDISLTSNWGYNRPEAFDDGFAIVHTAVIMPSGTRIRHGRLVPKKGGRYSQKGGTRTSSGGKSSPT
ncbi:hypothetical protein Slin15195_G069570 [Septoria linicola]|uniref:F-box domain-containing protein n=1 Tax=Septoria linicola TaxID=215465 RepID=A0A9Q9AX03_9PEZI|nr:hypothetical protein Slin15195_G069570 [Septoria linicola]